MWINIEKFQYEVINGMISLIIHIKLVTADCSIGFEALQELMERERM